MADFCTYCSKDHGFSEPDIDLEFKASIIDPGYLLNGFICEGCGLVIMSRESDGTLNYGYIADSMGKRIKWVSGKSKVVTDTRNLDEMYPVEE